MVKYQIADGTVLMVPPERVSVDPENRDALWVPVIAKTREACSGTEARSAALQYIQEKYNQAGAVDDQSGPHIDDRRSTCPRAGFDAVTTGGVMTPEQYRQLAAQSVGATNDPNTFYVTFYRIRREGSMMIENAKVL